MIALIQTIILALDIYWWLLIASAEDFGVSRMNKSRPSGRAL